MNSTLEVRQKVQEIRSRQRTSTEAGQQVSDTDDRGW